MTKVLFPYQDIALDIKLNAEPENHIAIMNICSILMQKIAYTNRDVMAMYNPEQKNVAIDAFFTAIENIRKAPHTV